jgi:hypothetical protein
LLNGWVTKKRMVAEAFAKLPFVCQAVDLFKRVDLAILLNHAEKSYCDPQLDTSFGMVSCVQGSHIVTFSGDRPALGVGATLCIKDDLFTVVKYETKAVVNVDTSVSYSGSITLGVYENDLLGKNWATRAPVAQTLQSVHQSCPRTAPTCAYTFAQLPFSGSFKVFFKSVGKVERYRLIPEDQRPPLLSTIFCWRDDGRLW